ncbi:hypothetical protein Bca101_078496 [Brassica carinata]
MCFWRIHKHEGKRSLGVGYQWLMPRRGYWLVLLKILTTNTLFFFQRDELATKGCGFVSSATWIQHGEDLVPRCNVIKALIAKGLLESEPPSIPCVLAYTNEAFLKRYVMKYDDKQLVTELLARKKCLLCSFMIQKHHDVFFCESYSFMQLKLVY